MLTHETIRNLRMVRQHLTTPADRDAYSALYRRLQPGQNVYWNGFGDPPSLSFRAAFDDITYNRNRQRDRALIKGRFAGGNLGWIVPEDLPLFRALYEKPLTNPTVSQALLYEKIRNEGPFTIQQIKEETGLLVKEITPILHRLQEAFLIYEDQYDGEWDRGWYAFEEMFPDCPIVSKREALEEIITRFAYVLVWFDTKMAKSYYKLPEKELRVACEALTERGIFTPWEGGYILSTDGAIPCDAIPPMRGVRALHRNDFLVKTHAHILKATFQPLADQLSYDHDALQYLLIDGNFAGVVVGHFRNGPYDLNDVLITHPEADTRRDEIIAAVCAVNFGKMPTRYRGELLDCAETRT